MGFGSLHAEKYTMAGGDMTNSTLESRNYVSGAARVTLLMKAWQKKYNITNIGQLANQNRRSCLMPNGDGKADPQQAVTRLGL